MEVLEISNTAVLFIRPDLQIPPFKPLKRETPPVCCPKTSVSHGGSC